MKERAGKRRVQDEGHGAATCSTDVGGFVEGDGAGEGVGAPGFGKSILVPEMVPLAHEQFTLVSPGAFPKAVHVSGSFWPPSVVATMC